MEYERSSALGGIVAMSRGRCKKCHQTIWESGERAFLPVAMVMAEPLLPEVKPNVDIYYDSGLKGGPTGARVLHSDLGSLLYEIYVIAFIAIPMIPWSIIKRLMRSSSKEPKKLS